MFLSSWMYSWPINRDAAVSAPGQPLPAAPPRWRCSAKLRSASGERWATCALPETGPRERFADIRDWVPSQGRVGFVVEAEMQVISRAFATDRIRRAARIGSPHKESSHVHHHGWHRTCRFGSG